jgi:hypothetical protein
VIPPSGFFFNETHDGTNSLAPFGGSDFSSYVDIGDSTITFESSNVVSGSAVQAISTSQVGFDFLNATGSDVEFRSEITSAGLGFYLANVLPACAFSSCPEITGGALSQLMTSTPGAGGLGVLGTVGFTFLIQDNGLDLLNLSGTLGLSRTVDGLFVSDNLDAARAVLLHLVQSTDPADAAALGFAWDATHVSYQLGQGSHHLTYSTTVFSTSTAAPLGCGASLVSFAGFGDPIGRGGTADLALSSITASDLNSFSVATCPGNGDIPGVNFTPPTFKKPFYRDGILRFDSGDGGGGGGQAVPEPATWALMILGFGAMGAVIRRRRTAGAPA